MNKPELALYRGLLGDIKIRVRQAQTRAALSANAEMLRLYWDIGRMIAARQEQAGWGSGVIPRLATDLKNELPEEKGFSHRNLKLMVQFFGEYPELFRIGQPPVAQLESAAAPTEFGTPVVAQISPLPVAKSPGLPATSINPLASPTSSSPPLRRKSWPAACPASRPLRPS
jgi:hypothetical protein